MACASSSQPKQSEAGPFDTSEWVKGAIVTAVKADGGCVFRPFVKTGIADDNLDDGRGQIIGFEPGNVQIDRKGGVVWERADEAAFIPRGSAKTIAGHFCKAPSYDE